MAFDLVDQLHGPYFRRSRKGACRECVGKEADAVRFGRHPTADTRNHVNDVRVELDLLVRLDIHAGRIAVQVVASQVDQHDVFGVFLRIVEQPERQFAVFRVVARTAESASDRIDRRGVAFDFQVCFGGGTENTVRSEIEIKEIGRRIDRTQCPVYLEIVTAVLLHEPSGEHDLEHVAPQAVSDSFADHLLVLFIGDR